MKLVDCKTAQEYRKYAINKENITNEDRQLCLNKQVTAEDHLRFATYVRDLTTGQIQQCLDKMGTLEKQYCKDKIKELK